MSNSVEKANRLPFYKAPQPKANLYQFTKKDIENSRVVKRFEMRPAPPPPTTISPSSSNSQVTEGGRANEAGIKLGDSIVKINDTDTKTMSLSEAHQCIQNAGGDIKLTVKKYTPILQLPIRKLKWTDYDFTVSKRTNRKSTKNMRLNWHAKTERKLIVVSFF